MLCLALVDKSILIDLLIAHAADVGSSTGRGTRAANWFADYLEDQQDGSIESLVLQGGIKGWVGAGEEYRELMEGFDAQVWQKNGIELK